MKSLRRTNHTDIQGGFLRVGVSKSIVGDFDVKYSSNDQVVRIPPVRIQLERNHWYVSGDYSLLHLTFRNAGEVVQGILYIHIGAPVTKGDSVRLIFEGRAIP